MVLEFKSTYEGIRVVHTQNGSYLVGPDATAYNDKELIPLIGLNETAIKISNHQNIGNSPIDQDRLDKLIRIIDEPNISSDLDDKVSRSLDTKILPDN